MMHPLRALPRGLGLLAIGSALVASASLAAPVSAAEPYVALRRVLTGYDRPLLVTHDGRPSRVIYIVEQTGRIKRATYRDGRYRKLGTFLDLTRLVSDPERDGAERGLLGLAFDPGYARNGRFYVNYTRRSDGASVVARFRRATNARADPDSRRVLLVVEQPYANHNGGHLAFGPDGRLYIGLGDGGSGGDPLDNAQSLNTRLGKILRIIPRDPDGGGPRRYAVPADNPFVGAPGIDDIWSLGLRNPWRFSFDRRTGDLWIGDVGQQRREEIDRAPADATGRNAGRGLDFGWDLCEGLRAYPKTADPCGHGTLPLDDYPHGPGACSVTGGYVHRGPGARDWRGLYVGGDYCGRLFVAHRDDGIVLQRTTSRSISSFGEDEAGRIFLTDLNGGIYRVVFRGPPPAP
jgi:hypothetical protein